MFSHRSLFQYSIHDVDSIHDVASLPSVDKANQSLPLSSPHAHEPIEDDGDGEFSLLFISPPIQHFFSQLLLPIKLLSLRPCWLTSLNPQVK
jgi:hypothetical protein